VTAPLDPPRTRPALRWALRALGALLLLGALAGGVAWWALGRSLPTLDGRLALPGLEGPVTVERDALGVPTVRGATRLDVARATGFLHAQDRLFQMDLLRRRAAGELAELVGPAALPIDRHTRRHRLREVARRALASLPTADRALLDAYAGGVDAGRAALGGRPFEYLLLRADPAPWRAEDSLLVALAMFIELTGESGREDARRGAIHDALPAPFLDLLEPTRGELDAPLMGEPGETPPLPGAEVLDLRKAAPTSTTGSADDRRRRRVGWPLQGPAQPLDHDLALAALGFSPDAATDAEPGSNSWAVDGRRSAHGGAILADDMHLGLRVPNTWYRAALAWTDPDGTARRLDGLTLPGVPALVAGSNGRVAWGFTNSYGDCQDLVVLEAAPGAPDAYLTPEGPRPLEHRAEVLEVRGGAAEPLDVEETVWGPVIDTDHLGRRRALLWTARLPGGVDLGLLALERAATLEAALDAASRAGIPPQNFLCADAAGRIGWTIAGRLPRRVGHDGRLPASFADGTRRWDGLRPPGETPRLVDPPDGRLWTANARVADGEALARIGDGGYALGARAGQIKERLQARETFSERDLLAIQLDDRALFLRRWQGLLLRQLTLEAMTADPRLVEVRKAVKDWGARAAPGSVGYRLVRAWRLAVTARILSPLLVGPRGLEPRLQPAQLRQAEGLVWRVLVERPDHLLAPAEGSWDRLLVAAMEDVLASLPEGGRRDLASRTWGEQNTAAIRHPFSGALPGLARLLDLPAEPLAGDAHMPRVQGPDFGASQRLVVSPGREAEGILHQPGGQSGHPRSPFYRAGHAAWVRGEPTPLLPGPATHALVLAPAGP
jgi:penicillin G amidase